MYLLDGHERHTLRVKTDFRCVCVFNPPVTGREDHDENGVYPLLTEPEEAHEHPMTTHHRPLPDPWHRRGVRPPPGPGRVVARPAPPGPIAAAELCERSSATAS